MEAENGAAAAAEPTALPTPEVAASALDSEEVARLQAALETAEKDRDQLQARVTQLESEPRPRSESEPEPSTTARAEEEDAAAQLASLRDEISRLQEASETASEDHAAQLAEMRNEMEALAMRASAEDDAAQSQETARAAQDAPVETVRAIQDDPEEMVRAAQAAQEETIRAAQEKVEELNTALVRLPGFSHLFASLSRLTRCPSDAR